MSHILKNRIDIDKCCIGLTSEKALSPGTEARIIIKHVEEFTIRATVVCMEKIRETPDAVYRMGIETDSVIILGEIAEI